MDLIVTDTLLYAPALIVGVLLTLYRNNILCFWDCHPAGVATKEFVKDVVVKMSTVQKMALNVGVTLRNFSTSLQTTVRSSLALVLNGIRSTALMIVNSIQGILITIQQNFQLMIVQMKSFLATLVQSFESYLQYLKNTTVALFQAKSAPMNFRIPILIATTVMILAFLWLGYKYVKQTKEHNLENKNQQQQQSAPIDEKPRRYPIRRRSKPIS